MIDFLISELLDIYILWTVLMLIVLGVSKFALPNFQNSIIFLNSVYYSFIPLFIIKYISSYYYTEIAFFSYSLIEPIETEVFSNLSHENRVVDVYSAILILYCLAICVQLVAFLKQVSVLTYIRRTANLDSGLTERVSVISKQIGLKQKVNVYLSHRPMSAYSFGVFKHSIVFPVNLKSVLKDEEIELILRHELIHIKNRDYIKHLIQTITKILFSFNPLVLWLDKSLSIAREVRCDGEVLNDVSFKKPYSRLLYFLATEWQRQLPETAVIAFYKPSHQLNRRIYMINLKSKSLKLKRNSRIASGLVLALVFTIACSNALEEKKIHESIVNEINEVENFPTSRESSGGKIYDFIDSTTKPEILKHGKITYPEMAIKENVEGLVLISFIIDENGFPVHTKIVKGHELLKPSALDAAKKYRFKPAKIEGKPVKVKWLIPFRFKLKGKDKK